MHASLLFGSTFAPDYLRIKKVNFDVMNFLHWLVNEWQGQSCGKDGLSP